MSVRFSILAIDQDTHPSNDTHGNSSKYVIDLSRCFCDLKYCHVERRYATFKLFYTDKTPADYEPQHFRPGDVDADKFFFTTHGTKEVPEKFSVGQLETGHHAYAIDTIIFTVLLIYISG
jgi:hypothetical protein